MTSDMENVNLDDKNLVGRSGIAVARNLLNNSAKSFWSPTIHVVVSLEGRNKAIWQCQQDRNRQFGALGC